ncbi:DUF4386 domain-containing protein [Congregibacter variabilis]|uniref:DUF4386 domain-containing protein n=1 Tax=Congregibacter variabilis TaxID=3081200 RepID=A0ABZ0I219_9GAMM|nr:DUF4386 domain-containing protein [Congregibacter sp. IMCC43200]
MHSDDPQFLMRTARTVGWSQLALIALGIATSILVAKGIDINLSADVEATARNMLDAETRLRAKAYLACLGLALGTVVNVGLFLILQTHGRLLAGSALVISLIAALLSLLGAVFAMNVAELASAPAYESITDDAQRLMLAGMQATSDYTSFHLSLVISSVANAGFFYLFLRSGLIPMVIAAWGVFASLLVAVVIVARDFVPALGQSGITISFMVANLIALISLGLYLAIKGVRVDSAPL